MNKIEYNRSAVQCNLNMGLLTKRARYKIAHDEIQLSINNKYLPLHHNDNSKTTSIIASSSIIPTTIETTTDCDSLQSIGDRLQSKLPIKFISSCSLPILNAYNDHRNHHHSINKIVKRNYLNKNDFILLAKSLQSKINVINAIIARLIQFITFNNRRGLHSQRHQQQQKQNKVTKDSKFAPNEIVSNDDRVRCCKNSNRYKSLECVNIKVNKNNNNIKNVWWYRNNSIGSHYIRQSLSLYAASGFLLMLCCLVIPAAAASTQAPHPM